jgi:hypothetical protein
MATDLAIGTVRSIHEHLRLPTLNREVLDEYPYQSLG